MKQISITLLLLTMLAGSTRGATIPVSLQGDHGRLAAVIQRPTNTQHKRIPLVIICHGFMPTRKETCCAYWPTAWRHTA